jgi:hypothetical protein
VWKHYEHLYQENSAKPSLMAKLSSISLIFKLNFYILNRTLKKNDYIKVLLDFFYTSQDISLTSMTTLHNFAVVDIYGM